MAGTGAGVSNQALQQMIADLSARWQQDIGEIKATLKVIEDRVRALENVEAGCRPLVERRLLDAWNRIEEHDKQLATLTKVVTQLQHANSIMTWVGGILGSTLIIWVVTQILAAVK